MTQIGVFVVRYYGGVHLGKKQFEIIEFLTGHAISQLRKDQQKREMRLAHVAGHSPHLTLLHR